MHMAGPILDALEQGQSSPILPWLDCLPEHVPLPWLYWTEEQIIELQEDETVTEAIRLREVLTFAIEASGKKRFKIFLGNIRYSTTKP